jgi:hypothetical protein
LVYPDRVEELPEDEKSHLAHHLYQAVLELAIARASIS